MAETQGREQSPLQINRGTTTVSEAAVTSIVGEAMRETAGAEPDIGGSGATLPGDNSPTIGEFFGNLTGSGRSTRGVSVEIGETQAAVNLTVTVPYGRSIPEITGTMRRTVIQRVENLAGLQVTEVNIRVTDVYYPERQ